MVWITYLGKYHQPCTFRLARCKSRLLCRRLERSYLPPWSICTCRCRVYRRTISCHLYILLPLHTSSKIHSRTCQCLLSMALLSIHTRSILHRRRSVLLEYWCTDSLRPCTLVL